MAHISPLNTPPPPRPNPRPPPPFDCPPLGTYIKEFVHGDLGRTVPSIGSLLNCRADILQLDVTNVEDKWSVEEDKAGGERCTEVQAESAGRAAEEGEE